MPRRIDYDHFDPLRCFSEQIEAIRQEMETRIPMRYREMPFVRSEERFSISSKRLPDGATATVGVVMKPGSDENKVVRWLEHAVIGFQSEIESLMTRRSVGMDRKPARRKTLYILSRRMLMWELSLHPLPGKDEPLCIVGANETDQMSRPAEIYLVTTDTADAGDVP